MTQLTDRTNFDRVNELFNTPVMKIAAGAVAGIIAIHEATKLIDKNVSIKARLSENGPAVELRKEQTAYITSSEVSNAPSD